MQNCLDQLPIELEDHIYWLAHKSQLQECFANEKFLTPVWNLDWCDGIPYVFTPTEYDNSIQNTLGWSLALKHNHRKQPYIDELILNGWKREDIKKSWTKKDLLHKIMKL